MDTNECANSAHNCSSFSHCKNAEPPVMFTCPCLIGYIKGPDDHCTGQLTRSSEWQCR